MGGTFSLTPQFPGRAEGIEVESITNGHVIYESCLCNETSIKTQKQRLWWASKLTSQTLPLASICCCCFVIKLCQNPCNPVAYSSPGSSLHGISQTRILERVALFLFRESSWPRDQISLLHWKADSLPLSHQRSPVVTKPGPKLHVDRSSFLWNLILCISLFIWLLIFILQYPLQGEGNGTPLQYSWLKNPRDGGAWWAAVHGVAKSWTRLSDLTFIFHFHALEKEMATHSSVLAWRIPGTAEPGRLPSMGLYRVRHDRSDLAAAAASFTINW